MNLEGYGPVAAAMGGASMAYDNGTAAVMNNPATLGLMADGSRLDVALGILAPSITANAGPMSAESTAKAFWMPAIGYAKKSGQLTYGVGVFSQGGMGTEYEGDTFMAAGSGEKVRSEVGVGRFIIPLAYNVDDQITVGGSLDYVWAGMDLKMALPGTGFFDMAMGTQAAGTIGGSIMTPLGNFGLAGGCSTTVTANCLNYARVDFSDSNNFTGSAKGSGFAGKLGGTFKVSDQLTLGMTYHSKTAMSDLKSSSATMSMAVTTVTNFGNFTGVVPITGEVAVKNFEWPRTIAFGGAYQVSDQLLVVADYKNIGWKDAMKNFSMTFTTDAVQADPVAAMGGLGGQTVDMVMFQNWEDQNVLQIGGAYKTSDALTLRAGLNLANNPVPDEYMNPLFPAIATNHLTLGVGYTVSEASSIDFSYVYVPKVTGGTNVEVDFGGYSAQLMYSYRM
jgi:long-chain fatty acid transport protein